MGKFKFIIADDEPRLRRGIVTFIENNFPEIEIVGEFEDGLEALELIKSGEEIHAAILDIRMITMSGLEVSQYIYDNRLPIKVIIITAHREFDYAVTAVNQHIEAILLKPIEFEKLHETISEVLDRIKETIVQEDDGEIEVSKDIYENILNYIAENFTRDIPLVEISNKFYMSESHFCRYFKKNAGKTFVAYLTELRIAKAKQLLLENVPLNEVPALCGYTNYKHFSKRFKQIVGATPKEYLRQRALGYEPNEVPPDALFHICEKLDALIELPFSTEVNKAAMTLLKEITKEIILPRKEEARKWQPPDSGPSKDD